MNHKTPDRSGEIRQPDRTMLNGRRAFKKGAGEKVVIIDRIIKLCAAPFLNRAKNAVGRMLLLLHLCIKFRFFR